MSFVGAPYLHDIFFTYSHGDTGHGGDSLIKQYSQELANELRDQLCALPEIDANTFNFFLDEDYRPAQGVDSMEPLREQLEEHIAGSSILVAAMSPYYLQSTWCKREREWWLDAQAGAFVTGASRVGIVRIWPTAGVWPAGLVDGEGNELVGEAFHDRTNEANKPHPHSWHSPKTYPTNEFRLAMLDLVGPLGRKLVQIRKHVDAVNAENASRQQAAAGEAKDIYLHARENQTPQFERVMRQLEDDGYCVLPVSPEPMDRDAQEIQRIRAKRVEIMSGCDAVLMLGSEDGDDLFADVTVVGRDIRNQARAMTDKPLPCGVLDIAGTGERNPGWAKKAKMFDVEWLDARDPPWRPHVQRLMQTAAAA